MSIKSLFENIADAIKDKNPNITNVTPVEMPSAIRSIPSGSSTAGGVTYDNTASGLTANNVQDAIDELAEDVSTINSDLSELKPTILASIQGDGTKTNSQNLNSLFSVLESLTDEQMKYDICVDIVLTSGSNLIHYIFKLERFVRGGTYFFSRCGIQSSTVGLEQLEVKTTGSKRWNASITSSSTTINDVSSEINPTTVTFNLSIKL